jgi:hypothetical protein
MKEVAKESTQKFCIFRTPFNLLDHYKEEGNLHLGLCNGAESKNRVDLLHFGDPTLTHHCQTQHFYIRFGKLFTKYADEDVAFNFREFFRVDETGVLYMEKDIISFLNIICKSDKTVITLTQPRNTATTSAIALDGPGVKEAKALSSLLQSHPFLVIFQLLILQETETKKKEKLMH